MTTERIRELIGQQEATATLARKDVSTGLIDEWPEYRALLKVARAALLVTEYLECGVIWSDEPSAQQLTDALHGWAQAVEGK